MRITFIIGTTALHAAAVLGKSEMVEYLVQQHGATVNTVDDTRGIAFFLITQRVRNASDI